MSPVCFVTEVLSTLTVSITINLGGSNSQTTSPQTSRETGENEQRSAEESSLTTITAIADEKPNGFFMRLSLRRTPSHSPRRGD
jgi:hypothetical protein